MSADDDYETVQAQRLLELADKAIEVRGPIGALRWASHVQVEEVRAFTAMIKADQLAGRTSVEMTEDKINAYNEMIWAAGLLQAVIGKTQEGDLYEKPGPSSVN